MTTELTAIQNYLVSKSVEVEERSVVVRKALDKIYHDSLDGIQTGIINLAKQTELQAMHKDPLHELCRKFREVSTRASSLSSQVNQLDLTLSNLGAAKEFLNALVSMKDIDQRLKAAVDTGRLDVATDIVKSVHEFRTKGFVASVDKATMDRYEKQEDRLLQDIRARKNTSTDNIETLARILFHVGHANEGLGMYFDMIRNGFSEKCLKHVNSVQSVASGGVNLSISSDDKPVHVEAVTNIFLEVADVIQTHQRSIEAEFGVSNFRTFLQQIEYEANAHAVRVIRGLMKVTSNCQSKIKASSADVSETHIRDLDFCLEELVTVIMRCSRFSGYIGSLLDVGDVSGSPRSAAPGSLQQVIEEITGVYVSGEQSLIDSLITRALNDDVVDTEDNDTIYSSIVDDSFYIFKKAIDRSILTGDPNSACAVLNNITTILQTEYKDYLDSSVSTSKRIFSLSLNRLSSPDVVEPLQALYQIRREESPGTLVRISSKDSLPHAVGNISLTIQYLARFKADCLASFESNSVIKTRGDKSKAMFKQCLLMFDVIGSELNDLHTNCIKYLLQQLRTSFITPFINVIENVDFDISEIKFADYQVNDPYMRAFVASLKLLLDLIVHITVPETAKAFISILCDYIALRFERTLMTVASGSNRSKFSILGATQLYQDVARLVSFFAQHTDVPVRNKFGRLQELTSILCVESLVEFRQMFPVSGEGMVSPSLNISLDEAKILLSARTEFKAEDISTIS